MSQYTVVWLIDIFADDPVEAAKIAQSIQRYSESEATVFHVVQGTFFEDIDDLVKKENGQIIDLQFD